MIYMLKQFDMPLLRFSATTDTSVPEIEILWYNIDHTDKLPLDLQLTPESLSKWLRHRIIPKNRANVHSLLEAKGDDGWAEHFAPANAPATCKVNT